MFCCIGEKLSHSFSKEIHDKIGGYGYIIKEIPREGLKEFFEKKEFEGLNVTIPYKETVIPFLDETDGFAKSVGAVNTVVNRNGKLYGYNTDVYGMISLIKRAGIEIKDKKVLILGTGGTSKTAKTVCSQLGAGRVLTVSRKPKNGLISYEEAETVHSDADVIINTTPCGMYPDTLRCPIDVSAFPGLSGVVDAIYNPLRTELVMNARARGIKAVGGLYMLVAQGVRAAEYFTGKEYGKETEEKIYASLVNEKKNIVLTGMPSSGKTTLGKRVAELTGRAFVDTDDLAVEKAGRPIAEIFANDGEKAFRDLEQSVIEEVSKRSGCVIATGGGAVLRESNVFRLKQNGSVIFIDRPLESLFPTSDRPLARDFDALKKRYGERYPIYKSTCDASFVPTQSVGENAETIIVLANKIKE